MALTKLSQDVREHYAKMGAYRLADELLKATGTKVSRHFVMAIMQKNDLMHRI